MSKANCDANEVLRLQAEVEQLKAQAAAMRMALHPLAALYHKRLDDLDDDAPLYQHCGALITVGDVRRAKAALAAEVGREMPPERLREAEDALQEMLGSYTTGERQKLLALWSQSLKVHIPDVEPERGHLSSLYGFLSMIVEMFDKMGEVAEATEN